MGKSSLSDGLDDGQPLQYSQRSLFEKSLGQNLSDVRVHTNDAAADKASLFNAKAFTAGRDIVFDKGQYDPGSKQGQHLLAEEVAHTAQQRGAATTDAPQVTDPAGGAETEAKSAASSMIAGQPTSVSSQPMAIARRARNEDPAIEAPPPPAESPAAADTATPSAPVGDGEKKPDAKDQVVDFSADRVGQEEEEGTEPVGPPQHLDQGKAEIAAKGAGLPKDGGAEELAGGVKPEAPAAGGPAGHDDGPPPPEVAASIQGAQNDTRDAMGQAEAESNAYKGEMTAKRDQFDAEQNALVLEKLKTMSPADKRSTLVEMGWDKKAVKKLKDAELDQIIEGKYAAEARKTKIMGMTPEELNALTPAAKIQHLVDLGIDKGDLDKVGQAKACAAFDQIMAVAHVPGQHKVKIKVKGGLLGKSWVVSVSCDAEGNTDIQAKKEGGFLSKLWGWVKAALPIILVCLAPLTGGASLIVLAVYQAAMAIKNGDWLGAVIGVAGALTGVGAFMAAKGALAAASTMAKIASVASKVKQVASTAQAAMMAAKAKNAGSLLAALAGGAATFATFASNAAGKFADTMTKWSDRLKKWATVVQGGEKVAKGIRSGDPITAIGGAFDTAVGVVGAKSDTGKNLQRASTITNFVGAGRRALKASPPDYAGVAEAALGIAGQLKADRRIDDASKIIGAADRLRTAYQQRDSNPAALAEAALDVASALQTAKYDVTHDENKDADGNALPDEKRQAVVDRYTKATTIVRAAGSLIEAASAKPRPNYIAGLDAATQLIASLTSNKKVAEAAQLTAGINAWTAAVNSKNDKAIMDAAVALGETINGLATVIKQEREDAKKDAQAQVGAGQPLPDDAGELPHFNVNVDVTAIAPAVDTIPGAIATTLDLPAAADAPAGVEQKPEPPPGPSPRSSTPGANYTVIPNDSLSAIASRFNCSVDRLRALNPQLAADRIYVGQRLNVPGADTLLTPSVTTDESYSVDPATVAATTASQRATAIQRAQVVIRTVKAQIVDWNKQNSLGADFYVYVRELGDTVKTFEGMLDQPSSTADSINYELKVVNDEFQRVSLLYRSRNGENTAVLTAGIVAATIVRDGAGAILSVLDRTKIISSAYQGVIAAIDEYSKGGSAQAIALRAALAAVIEQVPDAEGSLKNAVNEGFRETADTINEFMADLKRRPDMGKKEKRELEMRLLAKVPTMFALGALKGRADIPIEKLGNIQQIACEGAYEIIKRVADLMIDGEED